MSGAPGDAEAAPAAASEEPTSSTSSSSVATIAGIKTRSRHKDIRDSARSVLSSFPGGLPIHVSEIKKLIQQDQQGADHEDRRCGSEAIGGLHQIPGQVKSFLFPMAQQISIVKAKHKLSVLAFKPPLHLPALHDTVPLWN